MHCRELAIGVGLLISVVASGCGVGQKTESCPGADCTPALQAVSDQVAALAGVSKVNRVWHFDNIDRGSIGGADVTADVTDQEGADALGKQIAAIYQASKAPAVKAVQLQVSPTTGSANPEVLTGKDGLLSDSEVSPCAETQCRTQSAAFASAWAADPMSGVTLNSVTWDSTVLLLSFTLEQPLSTAQATDQRIAVMRFVRHHGLKNVGLLHYSIKYSALPVYQFTY